MKLEVHGAAPRSARSDTPWEYRALIWNFTRRDLKSRYRATALGWAWSLMGPLATIAIYSVVFSVFIRIEPPPFGDGDPGNYAVWLICGLVTWNFLNLTINRSIPAVVSNGPLMHKVYLPPFVPVIASGTAIGIQSLIEFGIVLVILIAFLNVSWTWLLVPLWMAALYLFANAVGYTLAIANVYWRDLEQVLPVVMQLLFFLSPVIYPLSLVPEHIGPLPVRTLVELNPISQFILVGRSLLYDLSLPAAWQVLYLLAATGAAVAVAVWVKHRFGRNVGELL